ncbi:MAG TPA: alkaline phosphatase D family protein [Xanthobacteraceae bacterium]|jgi:alkaline phosphatase D|nr:alkaline phosphatase D family protein [Xanthobacteraceae bacterium]
MSHSKRRQGLSRRRFIGGTASTGLALVAAPAFMRRASAQSWRSGYPFSLGVASGAPRADGFVLWTRLAPDPLSDNPETPGGMSGGDVTLRYEIATDDAMSKIIRRGEATAERAFGYSVHLDVGGFEPGRSYWYRFLSGEATSGGPRHHAAGSGTALDRLRFGYVSCANFEHGYFSAYRHLTDENPEFVLFLGDYIYETIEENRPIVRRHSDGVEASTLPTYRNRYAQYRRDPDLARLHAQVPSLVTWDDHEVQNDYADQWSEYFDDPAQFLIRRAAAYQAFYEHMPVRPILSHPNGPLMRVYDRFSFSDLIEISLLDGRQYRSREACYGPPKKGGGHLETNGGCPERLSTGRTMLGFDQEAWLYSALAHSKAQWNLIAQDVLMAQLREKIDGVDAFWTDDWDGYPANRTRLLQHVHDSKVPNPVVASGDIHSFFANDLRLNFDDPQSPIVATEFVGTSIASYGPPYDPIAEALPDNPHVHYFESRRRGYVIADLQRDKMNVRMRAVSDAHEPKATIETLKTYVVESGRPGVVEA